MHEFSCFRDYQEGDEVVSIGVGARLIISVELVDFNLDVRALGLPGLAAAAQLNYARMNTRFCTIGLHGPAIMAVLPKTVDTLNTEGYARIIGTVDKIRKTMTRPEGVIVSPDILGVAGPGFEPAIQSLTPEVVARVAALQCIANGMALSKAENELFERRHLAKEYLPIVHALYRDVQGPSGHNAKPESQSIDRAKKLLFGTA